MGGAKITTRIASREFSTEHGVHMFVTDFARWFWKTLLANSTPRERILYCVVYFVWGLCMHHLGILLNIARFTYWWQVLDCYVLYMVPVSIVLRKLPFHEQYAWGVVAIAPIELGGYGLGTSKALGVTREGNTYTVEYNPLAQLVDLKNFSLVMVMFFGLYFPWGNRLVARVHKQVFGASKDS